MYYSVDRIEENIAVLIGDDKSRILVPVCDINIPIKEGDVLINTDSGFIKDDNEKEVRVKRITQKLYCARGKRKR